MQHEAPTEGMTRRRGLVALSGSEGGAAAVAVIVALLLAASPRAAAGVAAAGAVAALVLVWRDPVRARAEAWPPGPAALAFYALAVFACISSLWSQDVRESLTKPPYLALMIAGAQAFAILLARGTAAGRARLGTILLAALVAGLLLGAVESATDQWLSRQLFTLFPRLYKGLEAHVAVKDGVVTFISETNIKRRIGLFTLLMWPAALLALSLVPEPRRRLAAQLVALLATAMIALGPHQSSWVAGVLGLAVFGLAQVSRRLAARALAVLFAAWVLMALPLVFAAHKAGLYEAQWLPNSARHRIVIWNATASEVLKAPLLGVGANATRRIFEEREAGAAEPEQRDGKYIVGLTRHAHNAYVQVWFELGAAGASLLALAGVLLIGSMRRLPERVQPFALAQFAVTAAVMSSSYGIWQMWFLASITLGAAAMIAASWIAGDAADAPPRREPAPAREPLRPDRPVA